MLTEKQKELRRTGIGGSDVAIIFGRKTYKDKTRVDLYLEKIGEAKEDKEDALGIIGKILEPRILEKYNADTGGNYKPIFETNRHPKNDFMIANIDAIDEKTGEILEIKTAYYDFSKWGELGTDELPERYLFQCAHYRYVCDAPRVKVLVIPPGEIFKAISNMFDDCISFKYYEYMYQRVDIFEKNMIRGEKDFWINHVLAKTPPSPISAVDAKKIYPIAFDKTITSNEEVEEMCDQLIHIIQQKENIMKTENTLKANICDYMKDADKLFDRNGEVLARWINVKQGSANNRRFNFIKGRNK